MQDQITGLERRVLGHLPVWTEDEEAFIQAELDGTIIVFPLGPSLSLSWASCQVLVNKDQTKVYRCELKSGYRFL